ncbi:MAG: hypothetical protein SFT90_06135 [Rickettsiales bacterium]|nr:hypothetical protein [Rickettsiales bacterium]
MKNIPWKSSNTNEKYLDSYEKLAIAMEKYFPDNASVIDSNISFNEYYDVTTNFLNKTSRIKEGVTPIVVINVKPEHNFELPDGTPDTTAGHDIDFINLLSLKVKIDLHNTDDTMELNQNDFIIQLSPDRNTLSFIPKASAVSAISMATMLGGGSISFETEIQDTIPNSRSSKFTITSEVGELHSCSMWRQLEDMGYSWQENGFLNSFKNASNGGANPREHVINGKKVIIEYSASNPADTEYYVKLVNALKSPNKIDEANLINEIYSQSENENLPSYVINMAARDGLVFVPKIGLIGNGSSIPNLITQAKIPAYTDLQEYLSKNGASNYETSPSAKMVLMNIVNEIEIYHGSEVVQQITGFNSSDEAKIALGLVETPVEEAPVNQEEDLGLPVDVGFVMDSSFEAQPEEILSQDNSISANQALESVSTERNLEISDLSLAQEIVNLVESNIGGDITLEASEVSQEEIIIIDVADKTLEQNITDLPNNSGLAMMPVDSVTKEEITVKSDNTLSENRSEDTSNTLQTLPSLNFNSLLSNLSLSSNFNSSQQNYNSPVINLASNQNIVNNSQSPSIENALENIVKSSVVSVENVSDAFNADNSSFNVSALLGGGKLFDLEGANSLLIDSILKVTNSKGISVEHLNRGSDFTISNNSFNLTANGVEKLLNAFNNNPNLDSLNIKAVAFKADGVSTPLSLKFENVQESSLMSAGIVDISENSQFTAGNIFDFNEDISPANRVSSGCSLRYEEGIDTPVGQELWGQLRTPGGTIEQAFWDSELRNRDSEGNEIGNVLVIREFRDVCGDLACPDANTVGNILSQLGLGGCFEIS